ncbi:hypothetical protein CMI37_06490 [Candidatus Pacearchaeota archaeon]|nr:hypothetical protein [Candidatus Pacearchaeota archaeon]
MTTNANKGHRIFGTNRSTKNSRNGGKGTVRFIDSLRTRWRLPQAGAVAASGTHMDWNGFATGDDVSILVPTDAGGTGVARIIRLTDADDTGGAASSSTVIGVGIDSVITKGTLTECIIDAINGDFGSGGISTATRAAASEVHGGIQGVTASLKAGTETQITLTASTAGIAGNDITVTVGVGSPGTSGNLSGGLNNHRVRKRIFEPGLSFGGSIGTSYYGSTVGRTNTSVGDKDLIRDSAA